MIDIPFIDYLNAVDDLLESQYGITNGDVDTASIAGCQDDGWTPEECVSWLEEEYDLERIDVGPYGGMNEEDTSNQTGYVAATKRAVCACPKETIESRRNISPEIKR
jgi:hypothetical protein